MVKILVIDDEPTSVQPMMDLLSGEGDNNIKLCDFVQAETEIYSFQPDVIILDLKKTGEQPPELTGNKSIDSIWKSKFCPIIIYSALPESLAIGEWSDHPFVGIVKKGSGSPQQVKEELDRLKDHLKALQETQVKVRDSLNESFRKVAPQVFVELSDPKERKDAVLRSARRRLAASMDTPTDNLASWEAYIYPPFPEHAYLGDLLQAKDTPIIPSNFSLVLTPTCDLASYPGRKPKVKEVLVAECIAIKDGIDNILTKMQMKPTESALLIDKFDKLVLTQGYYMEYIPIPGLRSRIPPMMVDLKRLHMIPIEKIGIKGSGKDFIRVASLDNPFRNFISWAYMQSACRPGLPDRDVAAWKDEIKREYTK